MAKLTSKERGKLPKKDFAGPKESYPDEDKGHARAALSRVSEFGSPKLKAEVRAKVHSKYPSMGKTTSVGKEVERRLAARDKK